MAPLDLIVTTLPLGPFSDFYNTKTFDAMQMNYGCFKAETAVFFFSPRANMDFAPLPLLAHSKS